MQKLLGVKLIQGGALREGHVFLPDGKTAGVFAPWDHVEPEEAEVLYPLYRSWDDRNPGMRDYPDNYAIDGLVDEENPDPAGFPAATIRRLGKGAVLHIPTEIFRVYWTYGYPDILAWFRSLLKTLQPDPLFETDALSFVEVSLRRKGTKLLVHFVNGNPGRDIAYVDSRDVWVDDIPAVGPIESRIRCAEKPGRVYWEPGGTPAETVWKDGLLRVSRPRLEIHTCLVVEDWRRPGR